MLTSEQKIKIAGNVIKAMEIEDEDLKQEIYLHALQHICDCDNECSHNNQNSCLFYNLVSFAKRYEAEANRRATIEISVSPSLQLMDEMILLFLRSRF